mgnify:CR=1 FL=1
MTSPSKLTTPAVAGFSLLEVLVALAIMSLIAAVVVANVRPIAPDMRIEMRISELDQLVSRRHLEAVSAREPTTLSVVDCNGGSIDIVLFPDGSGTPARLCVREGQTENTYQLHPFLIRWLLSDGDDS